MIGMKSNIPVIAINVNRLNSRIKRQIVRQDMSKQYSYAL